MKKILLLLIFVPLLFSCTKSNTRVYGKVTEGCSGAPVGGWNVELWTGEKNSSKNSALKNSMKTYSDGSFDFSFHALLTDNHYFVRCNGYQSDYISKKTSQELNVQLSSNIQTSNLLLSTKNISPYDNNDSIYIDFVRPNTNYPTFHMQFIYKGSSVETTNSIIVNGCPPKLVNLSWAVTKNHITTNFTSTVTCTNGGNSTFQINY